MTINTLISKLEKIKKNIGGNKEICLYTYQNYTFTLFQPQFPKYIKECIRGDKSGINIKIIEHKRF